MVVKRRDRRRANDLGNAGHFPGLKNKTKPRKELKRKKKSDGETLKALHLSPVPGGAGRVLK